MIPASLLVHGWILDAGLALAPHGTLNSITCFAAAIVSISIGTAVVKVCDRLLLIASSAELDGHIRGGGHGLRCLLRLPGSLKRCDIQAVPSCCNRPSARRTSGLCCGTGVQQRLTTEVTSCLYCRLTEEWLRRRWHAQKLQEKVRLGGSENLRVTADNLIAEQLETTSQNNNPFRQPFFQERVVVATTASTPLF